MFKRTLSLILCAVLALCCLAASAAAEAPIEITVAMNGTPTGWPASEDENFIQQQILEKTGVRFVMSPLDNYAQTLNLLVANDDAPDMFIVNADTMRTYAAQDMLLDLTPYKETGLKCIFDKFGDSVDTPYLYYNDRMYMIPTNDYQDNAYYTMYFRQDWADKLNLQAPTTVEGLFEFCSAIAAADLDQNGQKDTIGFTGYGLQALDAIANAYDAGLGNYVIVRDNKVTSSLLQPGMKDALTMIRKFFEAGLVDPDILGAKSEIKAHTLSGNFSVSVMKWSDISKAAYLTQAHEINPDLVYGWCGPMASEIEGAESVYGILDYNRNTRDKYVINANVSEEKLEAIFKVLQYLCTDEGSMMVYVGLEGDHWQRNADNSITMTERGKTETLYAYKYQILGREEAAYLALKFPEAADVVAYCLNTPRYIIYNKSVEIPADFYLSDLENYVNMQLIAFVKGERPVAEYDQFIDELYKTYDFQRYLDICAEQLVALGYAAK